MKALIVESAPELAESISLYLQLRWPETAVLTAREGWRAIELVQTEAPDVAILDLDLAGGDGGPVLRLISLLSDVPIVALTSSDEAADLARALDAGADCCITKPLSAFELVARVKALLRRAGVPGFEDARVVAPPRPAARSAAPGNFMSALSPRMARQTLRGLPVGPRSGWWL